jgi:hypothetical protein
VGFFTDRLSGTLTATNCIIGSNQPAQRELCAQTYIDAKGSQQPNPAHHPRPHQSHTPHMMCCTYQQPSITGVMLYAANHNPAQPYGRCMLQRTFAMYGLYINRKHMVAAHTVPAHHSSCTLVAMSNTHSTAGVRPFERYSIAWDMSVRCGSKQDQDRTGMCVVQSCLAPVACRL